MLKVLVNFVEKIQTIVCKGLDPYPNENSLYDPLRIDGTYLDDCIVPSHIVHCSFQTGLVQELSCSHGLLYHTFQL